MQEKVRNMGNFKLTVALRTIRINLEKKITIKQFT